MNSKNSFNVGAQNPMYWFVTIVLTIIFIYNSQINWLRRRLHACESQKNGQEMTEKEIQTVEVPQISNQLEIQNSFDFSKNHCLNPKNQPNQDLRFVFLKVHKCGSTFTRIILQNFMGKYNIPRKSANLQSTWLAGHPGPYLDHLSDGNGVKDGCILEHFTWNNEEIDKTYYDYRVKNSGKKVYKIGIIRQPLAQWISSWYYFNSRGKNSSINCWREPYEQVFSTVNPFSWEKFTGKKYVPKNPNEPFNSKIHVPYHVHGWPINITTALNVFSDKQYESFKDAFWGWRQMNMMSFEYGLDWRKPVSDEKIEEVINQFDLIIILERLVESLILLKKLLCMEMEDIVAEGFSSKLEACTTCQTTVDSDYFPHLDKPVKYTKDPKIILSRNNDPGLTDEAVNKIEKHLIFNDIKLYNAIGRKFRKDVEAFGFKKMQKERQEYVRLSGEMKSTVKKKKRSTNEEDSNYIRDIENVLSGSSKNDAKFENFRFKRTPRQPLSSFKPEFAEKLSKNMIVNGLGYCGYYKELLGFSPITNIEIFDPNTNNLRQPWIHEVDFGGVVHSDGNL